MKTLTTKQILRLLSELIAQTGGSDGIRDERMLDSALLVPFQNFDGKYGLILGRDIRE